MSIDSDFGNLYEAAFGVMKQQVDAGAVRRSTALATRLRGRLFRQQLDFMDDPERHKVLLCPRRSGKSYAIAIYIFFVCLRIPYANVVFIARTRDKAREILWELLKKLDKEFEIGIRFSEVHTAGWFPNGSRFRLRGCETVADIEQFRGEPFHAVFVDECASFPPGVLDPLLDQAIEPTLGDYLGTLIMSGTPGSILAGRFYKASGDPAFDVKDGVAFSRPFRERNLPRWQGVEYGWSFHSWTRKDNVILPHLWDEALRVKKLNLWDDTNPNWIREYLGRWIANDSNLVYRFSPERNLWTPGKKTDQNPFGLPTGHVWRYVMGLDFGHKDPFALQVVAYSDTHPKLYHVYEYVERGLLPPQMAAKIKSIREIADIECIVADFGPYGELLQAQFASEYDLAIERTFKKDKRDHIDLLNADFADDRCYILEGSEVARQMLSLSWDDTGLKERSGMRNDACDALVYTWRRVQHHFSENPAAPSPEIGTPEWEEHFDQEEVERAEERWRREQDPEYFPEPEPEEILWP